MRAIKAIPSPTQHRMQLLERPIVAAATMMHSINKHALKDLLCSSCGRHWCGQSSQLNIKKKNTCSSHLAQSSCFPARRAVRRLSARSEQQLVLIIACPTQVKQLPAITQRIFSHPLLFGHLQNSCTCYCFRHKQEFANDGTYLPHEHELQWVEESQNKMQRNTRALGTTPIQQSCTHTKWREGEL